MLGYWSTVLWHVRRSGQRVRGASAGVALARAHPSERSVAIIIPAHNEEEAIARLIPTLRAQDYHRFRVVLCLDRCDDRTEQVARSLIAGDPRFEMLSIASCPEGWAGKTNAVWTGVRHATREAQGAAPDLLLFADADTMFHPSCVSAAVAILEQRSLDLLSLLSTMTYTRWFERIVQPAAGMELMRQYPLLKSNGMVGRNRPFANGQFMLFRREAYEAVGGHEAVRDELLEDMALARAIAEGRGTLGRSGKTGVVLAQEMLTCRMYDTWEQFRLGWKRIYIETAKRRVRRLRDGGMCALCFGAIGPAIVMGGAIVSAWRVVEGWHTREQAWWIACGVLACAAIVVHVMALAMAFAMGRTPLRSILSFTLGSLLVSRILLDAARDLRSGNPVKWGGKEYRRDAR